MLVSWVTKLQMPLPTWVAADSRCRPSFSGSGRKGKACRVFGLPRDPWSSCFCHYLWLALPDPDVVCLFWCFAQSLFSPISPFLPYLYGCIDGHCTGLLACRLENACSCPRMSRSNLSFVSHVCGLLPAPSPPPPARLPTRMHRAGMWGAVGHMCIPLVSCCTVVGYSGQEPWCVIGTLSTWVVMSPSEAAWLQGLDYEHMVGSHRS